MASEGEPTLTASGRANGAVDQLNAAKDTAISTAQSTFASVKNSTTVQNLNQGPLADNVRNEASKTQSEFQNLSNSRYREAAPAATGQPLTQYHSMFYNLLSWENPRATSIAFAASIAFIFMCRYLNVLHYTFKICYFVFGVTASLEVAGKLVLDNGLATRLRPRQYWTIPRESLERSLDDVEQLINFFVIEFQRILYAENVYATIAVFFATLISYGLIKVLPFWGLCLLGTSVTFTAPLIYQKNKETIDGSVAHVQNVVGAQANQIRDLAAHHTNKATATVKDYAGEYSSKAQEMIASKTGAGKTSTNAFPEVPAQQPTAANAETSAPVAAESDPLLAQ